jgi:diacylglycerol kinase family enzyme
MTATPPHLSGACLVLNTGAGQILTAGAGHVGQLARNMLGSGVTVVMAAPEDIAAELQTAFQSARFDTVIAGGGDGTVSAAGKLALDTGKTLGVVPLGTMNLFARALGMPQELEPAFHALTVAHTGMVDVGEVNGEPFFNHVSVGLHARMVRMRDRMRYAGRTSKIINSVRALRRAVAGAPLRRLDIEADGKMVRRFNSALTVVTVNPVPDEMAHLPFRPWTGVRSGWAATCMPARVADMAVLLADLAAGNWSQNQSLAFVEADSVKLNCARQLHASIDGEVALLDAPLRCRIRPAALKVLLAMGERA